MGENVIAPTESDCDLKMEVYNKEWMEIECRDKIQNKKFF